MKKLFTSTDDVIGKEITDVAWKMPILALHTAEGVLVLDTEQYELLHLTVDENYLFLTDKEKLKLVSPDEVKELKRLALEAKELEKKEKRRKQWEKLNKEFGDE